MFTLLLIDLLMRAFRFALWIRKRRINPSFAGLRARRTRPREWLITPISLVIVVATLYWPLPVWVGFQLSRPAIERLIATKQEVQEPEWAGLFRVRLIRRWYNGTVFVVTGRRYWRELGFVLIPEDSVGKGRPCYIRSRLSREWHLGSYSNR